MNQYRDFDVFQDLQSLKNVRTEDKGQKTEDRGRRTGDRGRRTDDREQEISSWFEFYFLNHWMSYWNDCEVEIVLVKPSFVCKPHWLKRIYFVIFISPLTNKSVCGLVIVLLFYQIVATLFLKDIHSLREAINCHHIGLHLCSCFF